MATISGQCGWALAFRTEGLPPDALRVYRIKGREEMSRPFCFEVTLVAQTAYLDLHGRIGRPATLTLQGQAPAGARYRREIHGRISSFVQLSGGRRYSQYQAILSPTLFPLGYTRNSRIFRGMSTVEIVEKVLTAGVLEAEQIRKFLHGTYDKRDFCVQYQESDLDFIHRLLEGDGIFYYFVHEGDKDIIVLADGPHAAGEAPQPGRLAYRDHAHLYEPAVHSLQAAVHFRPGTLVLRDYRFKNPKVDLEARRSASDFADHHVYHYPGEYVDEQLGQRLARIRHEELQCQRSRILASSNCPTLLPGHTFHLDGMWRRDLSRDYLLLEVRHDGVQPRALGEEHVGVAEPQYTNEIVCIPSDLAYRPPRVTPKPFILGVQSAVVVGPAGEEIHCDEHGRVKVQFHWDRQGGRNDESSCWIRVSQPWGGAGYGGMFIPRIGQEVLVQFLEGDPDRPVIVGRVYNGENQAPHPLPINKTQSVIMTQTVGHTPGHNELRFEDRAGREEVYLRAERNFTTLVRADMHTDVHHNSTEKILLNKVSQIGANSEHLVGGSRFTRIAGDDSLTVDGAFRAKIHGEPGALFEISESCGLRAEAAMTFSVGSSKIVLLPDRIVITSDKIVIKGGVVKLNCSDD